MQNVINATSQFEAIKAENESNRVLNSDLPMMRRRALNHFLFSFCDEVCSFSIGRCSMDDDGNYSEWTENGTCESIRIYKAAKNRSCEVVVKGDVICFQFDRDFFYEVKINRFPVSKRYIANVVNEQVSNRDLETKFKNRLFAGS